MKNIHISQTTYSNTVPVTTQSIQSQAPIAGRIGSQWQNFSVTSCTPNTQSVRTGPQFTPALGLPMHNVTQRYPYYHGSDMGLPHVHPYFPTSGGFPFSFGRGGLPYPSAGYSQPMPSGSGLQAQPMMPSGSGLHAQPVPSGSGLHSRHTTSSAMAAGGNSSNTPGSQDMNIDQRTAGRKKRKPHNSEQKSLLESCFTNKQYLSRHERAGLAVRTNLTEGQVKVWFQNRRMKAKKQERLLTQAMPGTAVSAPQSAGGAQPVQPQRPVATASSSISAVAVAGSSAAAVSSYPFHRSSTQSMQPAPPVVAFNPFLAMAQQQRRGERGEMFQFASSQDTSLVQHQAGTSGSAAATGEGTQHYSIQQWNPDSFATADTSSDEED